MIFHRLSVARNWLRPVTASLTILVIKRGPLCNFAKTVKGSHFMGQGSTGLKCSIITEF